MEEITRRQLRMEMKSRRAALKRVERMQSDKVIQARAEEIVRALGVGSVFIYCSYASEVGTKALIERLMDSGVNVFLPKVRGAGRMDAVEMRPELLEEMYAAKGIFEPQEGNIASPGEIGLTFVPGLAFDVRGGRLGYGGGYYDRYLPMCPAPKIALAYSCQVVEHVDMSPWDEPVDAVLTENGIISGSLEFSALCADGESSAEL